MVSLFAGNDVGYLAHDLYNTGICAEFCSRAAQLGAKGIVVADVRLTDRAQEIGKIPTRNPL